MSSFALPISPRLVKGGIVTMDPDTSIVQTVIALQYNPDSLTRSLQIQAVPGGSDGVRVDAVAARCDAGAARAVQEQAAGDRVPGDPSGLLLPDQRPSQAR